MHKPSIRFAATLLALAAMCGTAAIPASAGYHPKIDPSKFSANITNRFFPIGQGKKFVYTGTKDGKPERVEMTILRTTRTILGVRCTVVSDIVTSNYTLVEKTQDWYAQDSAGNVWYFGENSAEYKNGVVTSTKGSWEAGVDNAQPGIVMHAKPAPGPAYRQEYRPGIAEDMAKVLSVSTTRNVPAGTFKHVVVTFDTDPLNPDKLEHKWYAPGVGLIEAVRFGGGHHEHIKLVSAK
jgi:hypothetical protein